MVSFSGNPQNMIIGAAADGHPGFAQYLALSLPAGAACLAVNAALLRFLRYGAILTAASLVVGFGVLAAERALGVLGWLGL